MEGSSKFYRMYMATMLTIAVVLLAVLVGGLWYGSLRVERATNQINGVTGQIKTLSNNAHQVQNINQGIQTLNGNLKQLNSELHSATSSGSFSIP